MVVVVVVVGGGHTLLLHCITRPYFFSRATCSTLSAFSISTLWCGWQTLAQRGEPTSRIYGLHSGVLMSSVGVGVGEGRASARLLVNSVVLLLHYMVALGVAHQHTRTLQSQTFLPGAPPAQPRHRKERKLPSNHPRGQTQSCPRTAPGRKCAASE